MGLAAFRIDASNPVAPVVKVNGVDVDGIVAWRLDQASRNELPTLSLAVVGDCVVEGEGVVHVVPDDVKDSVISAMSEFLDQIDPDTLEQAMLETFELHGIQKTGEAALVVLKKWVKGER
jgi:hypothetical protein